MILLVWGSRRRDVVQARGAFDCPICKGARLYELRRAARYFTLLHVPIVRLGAAVEYVLCLSCRGTLKRDVLDATPFAVASPPLGSPPLGPRLDPPADARTTTAAPLADGARLTADSTDTAMQAARPAALAEFVAHPGACAEIRPAFGQSAFARATYARQRRPAPGFAAYTPSQPAFFTPRR